MENNPEPDYIAFKKPGDDFLTWYDRSAFPATPPPIPALADETRCTETTLHATGKFVTRNDGEVAEVWAAKWSWCSNTSFQNISRRPTICENAGCGQVAVHIVEDINSNSWSCAKCTPLVPNGKIVWPKP